MPWHLVIRVKFGTYKQNWDFFGVQNLGPRIRCTPYVSQTDVNRYTALVRRRTTESKVSTLNNVVEKQTLSESIQIWNFPLGKETDNDKHYWIRDYMFIVIIYSAIDQGYMGLSLAS